VLKLLKTLNNALGDSALPASHIDEAFEVWWPKLEERMNNLPSDAASAKPTRPDRELLEEILAVVRNQSRANAPLRSRVAKSEDWVLAVLKAIDSMDPHVMGIRVVPDDVPESAITVFEVTSSGGRTYRVDVPTDFPREKLRDVLKPQIPLQERPTARGDSSVDSRDLE
jgi:hypothetical protein